MVAINLTQIIGYEMLFLNFARNLYELTKYYDNLLLQLSFLNVLNFKLYGFNRKYSDALRYERSDISNKQHNNFKLNFRFNSKTLTDKDIIEIAKLYSEE